MQNEKLLEKLPHLAKAFEIINDTICVDGKTYSLFDFDCRIEKDALKIYDKDESYHYNYEDDINESLHSLEWEFGIKSEPYKDKILPQIEEALKQDGFNDEVLEWDNNVIMTIHIPEKLQNILL